MIPIKIQLIRFTVSDEMLRKIDFNFAAQNKCNTTYYLIILIFLKIEHLFFKFLLWIHKSEIRF